MKQETNGRFVSLFATEPQHFHCAEHEPKSWCFVSLICSSRQTLCKVTLYTPEYTSSGSRNADCLYSPVEPEEIGYFLSHFVNLSVCLHQEQGFSLLNYIPKEVIVFHDTQY